MADASANRRIRSVLEDPGSQAVARVYAQAFLDAAGDRAEESIGEFESFVHDVLEANTTFESLLSSALLNRDERQGLIDRTVAPFSTEFFANFLRVLARHERLGLLAAILEAAKLMHEQRNNRQRVQVVSARPLSAEALNEVRDQLRQKFSFEPLVENLADPRLIGGLVVRVGNSVYDGSLRSRLNQLAKRMRQRSLHEIQSGRDRFSSPEGD